MNRAGIAAHHVASIGLSGYEYYIPPLRATSGAAEASTLAIEETLWVRTTKDDGRQAYFDACSRVEAFLAERDATPQAPPPPPRGASKKLLRIEDGTAETTTEVTEYVPRILVEKKPVSLAELRAENQRLLVKRAAAVIDLFAVPSDDTVVVECRRVAASVQESPSRARHLGGV